MSEKQRLRFGGLSRNRIRFVAPSDIALTPPAGAGIPLSTRTLLAFYGQSNGNGVGGVSVLYPGPFTPNYRVVQGNIVIAPLSESLSQSLVGTTAQSLTNRESGRYFVAHNGSVSGFALSNLVSGTTDFNYLISGVIAFNRETPTTLLTSSLRVGALFFVHGETDDLNGLPTSSYASGVLGLRQDFEREANRITTGSSTIPLIYVQEGTWNEQTIDRNEPYISLVQNTMHDPTNGLYLSHPPYFLSYTGTSPNLHFDTYGHLGNSEYFAKIFDRVVLSGSSWTPLRIGNASVSGNVATLTFEGGEDPLSPLFQELSRLVLKPFMGLSYHDPTGPDVYPHIQTATMSGRDITVVGTEPFSATGRFRVGYNAFLETFNSAGGGNKNWTWQGSNIAISSTITSSYWQPGFGLHDYAVVQERQIDVFVSGNYTNTDDLAFDRIRNNGVSFLTAYSYWSTLQGATSAVVGFKLRQDGGTIFSNTPILMAQNGGSGRTFDIRGRAGGSMDLIWPSSTLSLEAGSVPAATFAVGTTYACVVIYNGAGATNADRLRLFISSGSNTSFSEVALTYAGGSSIINSIMVSGSRSDFEVLGVGSNNRFSGSLGNIAIYRNPDVSLPESLPYLLFPQGASGSMSYNLATSSLGTPDNNWMFNGNLRDRGLRKNHLYDYTTGSLVNRWYFGNW